MKFCPWCLNPDADENTPGVPDRLCRAHEAEYDGLTVDELDRRDREQYAEWADTVDWGIA